MRTKIHLSSKIFSGVMICIGLIFFVQALLGFSVLPVDTVFRMLGYNPESVSTQSYVFWIMGVFVAMIPLFAFAELIKQKVVPHTATTQKIANNLATHAFKSFFTVWIALFIISAMDLDVDAAVSIFLSSFFVVSGLFSISSSRVILDPREQKEIHDLMKQWKSGDIHFRDMTKGLKEIHKKYEHSFHVESST